MYGHHMRGEKRLSMNWSPPWLIKQDIEIKTVHFVSCMYQ